MFDKLQQAGTETLGLVNGLATHSYQVNEPKKLWAAVRLICDRMMVVLGANFGDTLTVAEVPPLAMGRVPIEEREYVSFLAVLASGGILATLCGNERYAAVIEALHDELDALDHQFHFMMQAVPFKVRRPGSAP